MVAFGAGSPGWGHAQIRAGAKSTKANATDFNLNTRSSFLTLSNFNHIKMAVNKTPYGSTTFTETDLTPSLLNRANAPEGNY